MDAAPGPAPPVGTATGRSLWRAGDFNRLWTAETVSVLGSTVSAFAIPTLAVLTLGASTAQVGLLLACNRLPFPFLALPVGVLVDRGRKRPMMIGADLGRTALVGLVPVLAAAGALHLWMLFVLAILTGVLSVVFDVAYLAYLPTVVGPEQLDAANGRLEVSFASASIGGPGIAGLLVQGFGAARAVAANAVSFLLSALALVSIRSRETAPAVAATADRRPMLGEIADGLRHVFGDPVLRSLLIGMTAVVIGAHSIEPNLIVFAYRRLGLRPETYGLALAVGGLGSLAGALLATTGARLIGIGRVAALSGMVIGVSIALMPIALVLPAVPTLAALVVVEGACSSTQNVAQVTIRQRLTPPHLQGRMTAVFRTAYWGGWPLGNLAGGFLGSDLGVVPVIVAAGVVSAAAGAWLLGTPAGRLRR